MVKRKVLILLKESQVTEMQNRDFLWSGGIFIVLLNDVLAGIDISTTVSHDHL